MNGGNLRHHTISYPNPRITYQLHPAGWPENLYAPTGGRLAAAVLNDDEIEAREVALGGSYIMDNVMRTKSDL